MLHSVSVDGFEREFIKKSVRGKQNSTLIFGREGKFGKMKLFPAVRELNPCVVTARWESG
jgi:hypothetical protein